MKTRDGNIDQVQQYQSGTIYFPDHNQYVIHHILFVKKILTGLILYNVSSVMSLK